jgi:hypothetical protein
VLARGENNRLRGKMKDMFWTKVAKNARHTRDIANIAAVISTHLGTADLFEQAGCRWRIQRIACYLGAKFVH